MDFEEKINEETEKLNFYHQICIDSLNEFSINHPFQLQSYEKEKINALLNRMFDAELDYLNNSPEDYFDLYEED